MQGATLLIAIVGSILVLVLPPAYALAAYIAALIWYPDYLRITIGTIDISAGRIVVAVLLLRCLCNGGIRRKFVWSPLDKWVALSMVVYVGMYFITRSSFSESIENRAGFLMDTFLAYFAARFCIPDRASAVTAVKFIAITLVPLALLGVIEAVTGWYSYRGLFQYCPWRPGVPKDIEPRWGFTRAQGPFSHPIMFGGCFVMFLPLIWALRHHRGYWGKLAYPLCGIVVIGALSSMSSGPWMMLIVVIFCLILEKYRHRLKAVLVGLVVLCVLIEIGSNRPFYHVIVSYADPLGGSGDQRAVLIDCAIEDFGDWWLAGYGEREVPWGPRTGMAFVDINNEFILAGVRYGILGIIVLCAVLVAAFRGLARAFRKTTDKELRSLYWAMGSTLVGVIVAWQGVGFFGQMVAIFYCILGVVGSVPSLATEKVPAIQRM
jgi:uncharacterized membrane protein